MSLHQKSPEGAQTSLAPIGLVNTYSTRNLGDAAIMSSIARLCPGGVAAACIDDESPLPVGGLIRVPSLNSSRRFISVGGDIFNNARPWLLTRAFASNVSRLASIGPRGMIFGQTIPSSCRGLSLMLLAAAARRLAAVVVRDAESHRLLQRHGVPTILSYDTAFVAALQQQGLERGRALLAAEGLSPERVALISVRPFDAMYPTDQSASDDRIIAIAEALAARGHQPAILVQSDVSAADSDIDIAQRLVGRCPGLKVVDCVNAPADPEPVATLIGVLALANIVVAVRYHTAVLRLVAGRQPFNLFYSRKGQDLGRRLGLPGCHIDTLGPDLPLSAIESTANVSFDPHPISAHVRGAFAEAFGALQ